MKHLEHMLRQVRELLDTLGIHPLILAAGVIFCLFFPRFFLLAAVGYGVFWVAKNIWFDPRRTRQRRNGH